MTTCINCTYSPPFAITGGTTVVHGSSLTLGYSGGLGGKVTYAIQGYIPAGVTITAQNGTTATFGTLSTTPASSVVVVATDSDGCTATETISITTG